MKNMYDILLTIILICLVVIVLVFISYVFSGKSKNKGKRKYNFLLQTKKGCISFYNPFLNFLCYGGAGSGKTVSIGKPLLREYIKHRFAGFIYDYKDSDLTCTTLSLIKKYEYPYKVYTINFVDLSKTYRFNPIKPTMVKNETLFLQLMNDFIDNYAIGDKNEWYSGAKGIFKGVALRFYRDYKSICTIPHILNFICLKDRFQLMDFLRGDEDSKKQASAYLNAEGSERTQASYLSTLSNYIADLSIEKNISYVLTGDDFDFNLIDPTEPKLICVANSYQIESIISPVVGLLVALSARQFTISNKVDCFYFLDEATTFKIPEFEKMPSVLREYRCSFTLLTQSPSKIEKMYSRYDKSSIEANFSNQFFGRTRDKIALESFTYILGKEAKKKISKTKGSSRGGENYGTTVSEQREERFDVNFFRELKAGEFIGTSSDSSLKDFHTVFSMYSDGSLPYEEYQVSMVTNIDIERNYKKIITDILNM